MSPNSKRIVQPTDFIWLTLFCGLMCGVVWGLFAARSHALVTFSSNEAQQDWTHWRNEVHQGNTQGLPVQRKIPRSTEPPTLVLLRDYFAVCLTAGIVLSALFFGTLLGLMRAACHAPAFKPRPDQPS